MSNRPNTDHVVMLDGIFTCLHCLTRYTMSLPCPIGVFVAASNAFVADHANCQPTPDPAQHGAQPTLF